VIEFDVIGLQQWIAGAATFDNVYEKTAAKALDAVMNEVMLPHTQRIVHVITGSLKASGKTVPAQIIGDTIVVGLRYGGFSQGVNNPVDYASDEFARGGSHDFLTPAIPETMDRIEDVLGGSFVTTVSLWN